LTLKIELFLRNVALLSTVSSVRYPRRQLFIGIAVRTSSPAGSNVLLQVFLLKAGSIGDVKSTLLSVLGSLNSTVITSDYEALGEFERKCKTVA
jgi:hypothetical protein